MPWSQLSTILLDQSNTYMPYEYITSINFSKLTTLASSVIMDPKIMDRWYSYIVQSAENNRKNIFGSSTT